MSDTPITDENVYRIRSAANDGMGNEYAEHVVPVEIARQLERELDGAKCLLRALADAVCEEPLENQASENALDAATKFLDRHT